MYCQSCGVYNQAQVLYCVKCGTNISGALSTETSNYRPPTNSKSQYAYGKSPAVAMILSLLIVGVGQLYNGDNKKGAYMLVGAVISGIISFGFLWFIIAIWSAVDAYQVANKDKPLWN
jgi:TM2 domain-containing membrane protein YozV